MGRAREHYVDAISIRDRSDGIQNDATLFGGWLRQRISKWSLALISRRGGLAQSAITARSQKIHCFQEDICVGMAASGYQPSIAIYCIMVTDGKPMNITRKIRGRTAHQQTKPL
jgi:hypothetical protein